MNKSLKSINNTNLSNKVLLVERAYMETKNWLGCIPKLSDFWKIRYFGSIHLLDSFNQYEKLSDFDKDDFIC